MNIISNFLSSILQFFLNLILTVCSLILTPIYGIFNLFFPDISEYMTMVTDFFVNNVYPSMKFIREIFFNITGTSRVLWTLLLGYWMSYFTIGAALRMWKLLLNIYSLIKNGRTMKIGPGYEE